MLTSEWKYIVARGPRESEAIQDILESLGFTIQKDPARLYIAINYDMEVVLYHTDCGYERITINDVIDYLVKCAASKPRFVDVKLNKEHSARIYEDRIVVGCQTFNPDIIDALVDGYNSLRED